MRPWRAPAMAGVAGLAAGLWASGMGMSCVVTHLFDSEEIDCPALTQPQCCDGCGGLAVADPVCLPPVGWTCPSPTVSSFACSAGRSRLCLPPVVLDAGACTDAGQEPSQEQYAVPGCEPQTFVCVNDGVLLCALRQLQDERRDCRLTAECVAAPLSGGCTGWGSCPPFAVNDAGLASFLDAGRAEVARYCACPGCGWSGGMCAENDKGGSVHCVYGKCTWVGGQVSYACADRRTGQCFQACAEDEACYTQVACIPAPDGGCLPSALDGGTPDAGPFAGDDLCHLRCTADGGCPAGQACFAVPFVGCGAADGGALVTSICCAADAGCR